MNRWILRMLGLGVLITFMLVALKQEARAQQEPDRSPGLDRLFDLTSYQGMEEMPYFGDGPGANEQFLTTPDVDIPYSLIVFQSYRNESDWNIFLADGSGGNQTQLTWEASADIHPRLNRGCSKIVFASNRSGNYDIYTMNLDGSGVIKLTSNKKDDVYPAWSYDGTLIVFQSYRDGNPEIYTIYADGTNLTRLTSWKGYDGTPAWSPEGRIAFSSDRGGAWGILVMNSDGSGVTRLTSQAYSMYPAWSPDGSTIAFSADYDGGGWLDLYVMNSDGSNPRCLYSPGYQTDALARSWSPDSQYIAFTQIYYEQYEKTWYWTYGALYFYDTLSGEHNNIVNDPREWHPDWQSEDILAPESSMNPLPAQSPAPVHVEWVGLDNGPTGIKGYSVQVRDGIGGAWTDWLVGTVRSEGYYPALGGHTYYFRIRAVDFAGNVEPWPANHDASTWVESYPPAASFHPLPRFIPIWYPLEWGGIDAGGSGIAFYETQYQDTAGGDWTTWKNRTTKTNDYFQGLLGHIYQYRARATDFAQNIGDWSHSSDMASTMLCSWIINGKISDHTDIPIVGAAITTSPIAAVGSASDIVGKYFACVTDGASQYSANWDKDGYGDLPSTISEEASEVINAALPPPDNIIQNWGFESVEAGLGQFERSAAIPMIITETYHTGQHSLRLSQLAETRFGQPVYLYHANSATQSPVLAIDHNGTIHLVWDGFDSYVYYTNMSANGQWAALKPISTQSYSSITHPQLLVAENNGLYILWWEPDLAPQQLKYAYRDGGGNWSDPVRVPMENQETIESFKATLDQHDNLHLVWSQSDSSDNMNIFYARRNAAGDWRGPYQINPSDSNNNSDVQLGLDRRGGIHIAWLGRTPYPYLQGVFYTYSEDLGITWTNPDFLYLGTIASIGHPRLAVDPDGEASLAWNEVGWDKEVYFRGILYSHRSAGVWSTPLLVIPNIALDYYDPNMALQIKLTHSGRALLLTGNQSAGYYAEQAADGTWGEPITLGGISWSSLQVDRLDNIYVFKSYFHNTSLLKHFVTGSWSEEIVPVDMYNTAAAAVAEDDIYHMAYWWGEHSSSHYITYLGFPRAEQTEEIQYTQAFTVPVSTTAPVLSFFYKLDEWFIDEGNLFTVKLNNGNNLETILSTSDRTNGWVHAWFDLSLWAGQGITITFTAQQSAEAHYLWAYLDEITVGSAHPDVWVSALGAQAAMPGDIVTLQLTYGNRSPVVEAVSTTITAILPDGLVFASASLTPVVNGSTLTWAVGDLPADSGPFTILVTASVAGDAVPGSYLTVPVEISAVTPELELVNNQREFSLYIGSRVYLPLLQR